jgi:glycosyltransferase involved in cell wall biosynthesis
MSCGLVTVLTDVAGNHELIQHGINGYLIRPNDIHFALDTLHQILKDSRNFKKIGLNARKTIKEKFKKELLAKKLHNFLHFFGKS